MKRFSILLVLTLFLMAGCFLLEYNSITEYYYADLSIKNNCSNLISDINIDVFYTGGYINRDGKLSYSYLDLSNGEQSISQKVLSGFYYYTNQSSSHFIVTLQITYNLEGVNKSVTVFDDGLNSSFEGYNNLSENELEKVYLKKDSNNTLVITDDGVELLQGE